MKHKDKDKFAYTIFNVLTLKHAAAAKSLQSCPTLCDPRDSSPPGFPVSGILQARTLEWVAISFSNAWKWKVKVKSRSRSRLLATPWTAAYQAPLSMDFPGKSTGVGCHCLLLKRIKWHYLFKHDLSTNLFLKLCLLTIYPFSVQTSEVYSHHHVSQLHWKKHFTNILKLLFKYPFSASLRKLSLMLTPNFARAWFICTYYTCLLLLFGS